MNQDIKTTIERSNSSINSSINDINMIINDAKITISKVQEYNTFKEKIKAHKNTQKPGLFNFRKRFNLWQESRALAKMEKHLKSRGFSDAIIEMAKNDQKITEDILKNNIKDSTENYVDSLMQSQLNAEREIENFDVSLDLGSQYSKNYIKTLAPALCEMMEKHNKIFDRSNSYEKENFLYEEKIINETKLKIKNNISFANKNEFKDLLASIQNYAKDNGKSLDNLLLKATKENKLNALERKGFVGKDGKLDKNLDDIEKVDFNDFTDFIDKEFAEELNITASNNNQTIKKINDKFSLKETENQKDDEKLFSINDGL